MLEFKNSILLCLLHVPTRLQSSRVPYLDTSSIYTPAAHLRTSMPLCLLYVLTPAARVQSSRSPYLYTSTSTRVQRTSRAPELHTSTRPLPAHPRPLSEPPYPHSSP